MVGLLSSRPNEQDPVDALIRRDTFQRTSVALARQQGGMVAGKVGDHGVVFLSSHPPKHGRAASSPIWSIAMAESAKRVGLRLHAGASPSRTRASWPHATAQRCGPPRRRSPVVCRWSTESHVQRSANRLRKLRSGALGQRGRATESAFPALRQICRSGAVALRLPRGRRSRPFASRARTTWPSLCSPAALDEKSFEALYASMSGPRTTRARSSRWSPYRHAISDIEGALRARPLLGKSAEPTARWLLARTLRRAAHAQAGRTGGRLRPRLLLAHLQARRGLDLRGSPARASSRARRANAQRDFARGRAYRTDVRISFAELLSPDVQAEDQGDALEFRGRGW